MNTMYQRPHLRNIVPCYLTVFTREVRTYGNLYAYCHFVLLLFALHLPAQLPVSYTHLDVYKRQRLYRTKALSSL